MELRVEKFGSKWTVELVAANGTEILTSCRMYANRRNAVAAAKLIAGSKFKVVVEE
jgi:uncharacterized protein YegP (UPF0339 family)